MQRLWNYRRYLWSSSIADLKNRYAGSSFGVFWNVIQPLLQILIFTFVFSQIMMAKLPSMESSTSFAVYLCAGLLPWGSFSELIVRGSNAFIENSTYLKKLAIPEYLFVLQNAVTAAIVSGITMILLLIVVLFLGYTATVLWLLIPLIMILFLLFGLGLALFFSCINVFFKDVGQILGTSMQIWMWLTPIVYVKELIPPSFNQVIAMNPAYYFINSLQQVIVFSTLPSLSYWLLMILFVFVSLIVGVFTLKKLRFEVRDVI